MSSAERRLEGLDALRGVAAVAVMLHHYTARYAEITGRPLPLACSLGDGHFGVELFFILSGFVIFMTLERTPRLYDFAASRAARLWPGFMACLFLTAGVAWCFGLPWAPRPGVRVVLANLTMMPNVLGTPALDGSYWTLAYELVFYGMAGAAYFLAGARRTEWICLVWLGLKFTWRILDGSSTRWASAGLLLFEFSPLFVIGIMLYRIRAREATPLSYALVVLAVALCAFGAPYPTYRPIPGWAYCLLMGVLALLVWFSSSTHFPAKVLRPLVFLGEVSYPLYLVHQCIGYGVIAGSSDLGLDPHSAVLSAIGVTLLLATAVRIWVERPGQQAIRAAFARFGPQVQPAVQPGVEAGAGANAPRTELNR
jgi:peptidoglycan/LPS O-acetylase OafA/YrhL